ncbi:MAG TPA: branched-chain amino acid ABC transporter substrate-binding protein [Alphaproteobacteria bacterium]|nr:branched-chain amino acid ABC transporter substrate-binding protein [Alphaproteobacteria bacterium]
MMKKLLLLLACLLIPVFYPLSSAHAAITIGLEGPITGPYAVFGEQMRRGAMQAIADINVAGGVLGQKLVLEIADDACDPRQAVAVANRMGSEGVKFVVGPYCSGSAIPASKAYMDEGILMITPASTNPALTDEAKDLIFRTCGRDDRQGAADGDYLLKHFKGQRIAIVQDESAYGLGIAQQVQKTLNAGGVQEVLFDAYTPGEQDYSALISKLKRARAQVVFIGGYHTEIGLIARQLKQQGAAIQIVAPDSLMTKEFWTIAGPSGEGVLMSFGRDPRDLPEAKAAIAALRKSGFEPEGYTLYTYAAVQVVVDGIKRAGAPDPMKAAAAIRAKPISTVIGTLKYDAKGDVDGFKYVMYRWHDGNYKEIGE